MYCFSASGFFPAMTAQLAEINLQQRQMRIFRDTEILPTIQGQGIESKHVHESIIHKGKLLQVIHNIHIIHEKIWHPVTSSSPLRTRGTNPWALRSPLTWIAPPGGDAPKLHGKDSWYGIWTIYIYILNTCNSCDLRFGGPWKITRFLNQ